MKNRIAIVSSLILMISILLITTIQPVRSAKFVLAAWDYPDEYGQGIEEVSVYQNISGEWVSLTPFGLLYTESTAFEINDTATGIKIVVKCWLNNTVVDAIDFEDGKNHLRHNVSLTIVGDISGEVIFSQQNFTYTTGTDSLDPMFYYQYEVNMSFSPIGGTTYYAEVNYEIYWGLVP